MTNEDASTAREKPQLADVAPEVTESQYVTAMAHFYRGELGRIMIWRQRLDAPTNWALASGTGVVSLGLSHPEITHLIFLIANVVVFLFLIIEARRYRYYDAFRARVRVLEAHFLVPVVMRKADLLQGDWRELLSEDLLLPSFKISKREAIGRRMVRNYAWMFLFILLVWPLKIVLHHGPISSFHGFLCAVAESQPLPHALFWTIVVEMYCFLAYFIICGMRVRSASGSFQRRSVKSTSWTM